MIFGEVWAILDIECSVLCSSFDAVLSRKPLLIFSDMFYALIGESHVTSRHQYWSRLQMMTRLYMSENNLHCGDGVIISEAKRPKISGMLKICDNLSASDSPSSD